MQLMLIYIINSFIKIIYQKLDNFMMTMIKMLMLLHKNNQLQLVKCLIE
nr:MAG TPA: hypothetical protein [Bacteriophage sp.]